MGKTEQERLAHLVFGLARPAARSVGRGKAKRKVPVALSPGIEREVTLRERWGHRQGTPQTHEHASRTHQGALARLYRAGDIDVHQLAAGSEIAGVVEQIGAEVTVRTASLETRIDTSRRGDGTFHESLGRVRREMAYGRWRERLGAQAAPILAIIVEDIGISVAARRHGMRNATLQRRLVAALDLWPVTLSWYFRLVDEDVLAQAHARLA